MKKVKLNPGQVSAILTAGVNPESVEHFVCAKHYNLMIEAVKDIIQGKVTNKGPNHCRIIAQVPPDSTFQIKQDLERSLKASGWNKMKYRGKMAWFPSLDSKDGFQFVLKPSYFNNQLVVDVEAYNYLSV